MIIFGIVFLVIILVGIVALAVYLIGKSKASAAEEDEEQFNELKKEHQILFGRHKNNRKLAISPG